MPPLRRLAAFALVAAAALPAPAGAAPGEIDRSFGRDGVVVARGDGRLTSAAAVAVLADGRVLAAGQRAGRLAAARFTAAGAPDTTFGDGGTATSPFPGAGVDMVLQPDGRVVVAGFHEARAVVARLLPDGAPDTAFGSGGAVDLGAPGATALALQPDGRLVVARAVADGDDSAITRLLPDGTPDPAFGSGGTVAHPGATLRGVAVLADGRIVVVGRAPEPDAGSVYHAALYGADGTPDAGFGASGRTSFGDTGANGFPDGRALSDVGALPGGGIAAAGADGIFRGGVLATALSFGADGALAPPHRVTAIEAGRTETIAGDSPDAAAAALAVAPDGALVLGGVASFDGAGRLLVARLRPEGGLDGRFGNGGVALTRAPGGRVAVGQDVAIAPDGRVVAGGVTQLGDDELTLILARYLAGRGSGPRVRIERAERTRRGVLVRIGCPLNETLCSVGATVSAGGERLGRSRRAQIADGRSRRVRVPADARGVRRVRVDVLALDAAGERRRVRRSLPLR